MMSGPTLFAGLPLPLEKLSPEAFEDFVYVAFQALGPRRGFRVDQKTGGPGDGGFDAVGRRIADAKIVCLQAKRNQDLGLPAVALELGKVALTSALERSEVAEHYIVSSGAVVKKMDKLLRETGRASLVQEAIDVGTVHADLAALREKCADRQLDVRVTIEHYVAGCESIVVWDCTQFDKQLLGVWSELKDRAERWFTVHPVLRERPRPDFVEDEYLRHIAAADDRWVMLGVENAPLPRNLRKFSAADPLAAEDALRLRALDLKDDLSKILCAVPEGSGAVLCGPGGAGKTTALRMARAAAAARRRSDPDCPLPVLVPLASYSGSLEKLITSELGITNGHWLSMPGTFLLLCDGLNELTAREAQKVVPELSTLLRNPRVSAVISMRELGLQLPVVFPQLDFCLRLVPFDAGQILELANRILPSDRALEFCDRIRERHGRISTSLLGLPFGVAAAASMFSRTSALPRQSSELVEWILSSRFDRNLEIQSSIAAPQPLLRALAEDVAHEIRVLRGRTHVTESEAQVALVQALKRLRERGEYGSQDLTDASAFDALLHHELLRVTPAGSVMFEHDVISGYLAAKRLASEWKTRRHLLETRRVDEAWVYGARFVSATELQEYLSAIAEVDLLLAYEAAIERGTLDLIEAIVLDVSSRQNLPTFVVWQCSTTLGLIGTDPCRQRLEEWFRLGRDDPRRFQAQRALVFLGDRRLLPALLEHVDRLTTMPVTLSGGEVELWWQAPPTVALAVARERLDSGKAGEAVATSVQTLRHFGRGSEDVGRIERVMTSARSVDTVVCCFHAMHALDAARAERLVREIAGASDEVARVTLLAALSSVGAAVDAAYLLWFAVEPVARIAARTGYDAGQVEQAQETSVSILEQAELSPEVSAKIRELHSGASQSEVSVLWRLAIAHALQSFDELALAALSSGTPIEVGYASSFARIRSWSSADELAILEFAKKQARDERHWFTWDGSRLLDLLLERNEREVLAEIIGEQLQLIVRAHEDVDGGRRPVLLVNGTDLMRGHEVHAQARLLLLTQPVVDLAARAPDLIPIATRLALLNVNRASFRGKEFHWKLFADIDPAAIDRALSAMTRIDRRVFALREIAKLGVTEDRIRVLREVVPACLGDPRLAGLLADAAQAMWCPQVASTIVDAMSAAAWPNGDVASMTERTLSRLADVVDRATADDVVAPALGRELHPSCRSVLELWFALGRQRPKAEPVP